MPVILHVAARRSADAAELFHDRDLVVRDLFHAIAETGLDRPSVAHELHQALRFYARGLIGAPHRAIEGDVTLDHRSTKSDRRVARRKAHFVARVTDGHAVAFTQHGDHAQVQI